MLPDNHVLLLENVELGTSYEYELFYAVPAKNRLTGSVDCFLLYPFVPENGEFQWKLVGEIEKPVVVDAGFMRSLPEQNLFRYSARFLLWKRKGLPVAKELYLHAEEICERMDDGKDKLSATRGGVQYMQHEITVCYELSTYSYVEDGEIFVVMPSMKDLEKLLVMEFSYYGRVLDISLGMPSGTFDVLFDTRYGSVESVVRIIMENAELTLRREYNVEFIYYSVYARGGQPGQNLKKDPTENDVKGSGFVGGGGSGGSGSGGNEESIELKIDK